MTGIVQTVPVLFCGGFGRVGGARGDCASERVGGRSLSLATDRVERILTLMKSQNVAIYNKK